MVRSHFSTTSLPRRGSCLSRKSSQACMALHGFKALLFLHSTGHRPLLQDAKSHGGEPVEVKAGGEVVEHHRKDDGHDISHDSLLFLLVCHETLVFGSRRTQPLLVPHHAAAE